MNSIHEKKSCVLTCEGTVIPSQDEIELLGVPIDNKLKFERKICKISRKVSQQVAVLNRLKKILPFELRIDIYRAFIAPQQVNHVRDVAKTTKPAVPT